MIAVGGTLLLAPGFVTDIFGLILLIPPTRAVVRRIFGLYLGRRFVLVGAVPFGSPRPGPGPAPTGRRHYDFDATAEEIDGEDPRLGS
jgi:UPF0716 protein FxsA